MKILTTIVLIISSYAIQAQTFASDTIEIDSTKTQLLTEQIKETTEHRDFFRVATGFCAFLIPVAYWFGNNNAIKNKR